MYPVRMWIFSAPSTSVNAGMLPLREAICEKLSRDNGLSYTPDQILCSNGAKQSVALAISVLCSPGDEVLIPAPFWVSYPEMVRFAGAKPVVVSATLEDGYRTGDIHTQGMQKVGTIDMAQKVVDALNH